MERLNVLSSRHNVPEYIPSNGNIKTNTVDFNLYARLESDNQLPARYRTIGRKGFALGEHLVVDGYIKTSSVGPTVDSSPSKTSTVTNNTSKRKKIDSDALPNKKPNKRQKKRPSKKQSDIFPLGPIQYPISQQSTDQQDKNNNIDPWYIGLDVSVKSPGMACRHPESKTLHLVYFAQNEHQKSNPCSNTVVYSVPEYIQQRGPTHCSLVNHTPLSKTDTIPTSEKTMSTRDIALVQSCSVSGIREMLTHLHKWDWSTYHHDTPICGTASRQFRTIVIHRLFDPSQYINLMDRHRQRIELMVNTLCSIVQLKSTRHSTSIHKSTGCLPVSFRTPILLPPKHKHTVRLGQVPSRNHVLQTDIRVLFEDYPYHTDSSTLSLIHEFTGLLKAELSKHGIRYKRLSNSTVKSMWSGNGSAEKPLMWQSCHIQYPEITWAISRHFSFDYGQFWLTKCLNRQKIVQRKAQPKTIKTKKAIPFVEPKTWSTINLSKDTLPHMDAPLTDLIDAVALSYLYDHPLSLDE